MTPPEASSTSVDQGHALRIALCISLGGFLMGFDASVISGAVGAIKHEFGLGNIALGWVVSSLSLSASIAMLLAGPVSDRVGRRPVLRFSALLCVISGLLSAVADSAQALVLARMLGGLGVGAALIVAPMMIAELAPADRRGRLVSLNQLNIVIGISAAFFSNDLILRLGQSGAPWVATLSLDVSGWRWMLGVEAIPALLYLIALLRVPESPRWLALQGRQEEALLILERTVGAQAASAAVSTILAGAHAQPSGPRIPVRELFSAPLRGVMLIALAIAVMQQISGINAVFFYAPMIFEQSGIGTNAAFAQAVLVGLVNLGFTVLAIALIDRVGRRPLLCAGVAGVAVSMLFLAWCFGTATYTLQPDALANLPAGIDADALRPLAGQHFDSDVAFRAALESALGPLRASEFEPVLINLAITLEPALVLTGILAFVGCFAMSLGPVMWVLLSELFPNRSRGLAVSVAGLLNSAVSFLVQLLFPWEMSTLGSALTFLIYGLFALAGLLVVWRWLPETRGKSLEELEGLRLRPSAGARTP